MRIKEMVDELNDKINYLDSWYRAHPTPFEMNDDEVKKMYDELFEIRKLSNELVNRI